MAWINFKLSLTPTKINFSLNKVVLIYNFIHKKDVEIQDVTVL